MKFILGNVLDSVGRSDDTDIPIWGDSKKL